MNKEQIAAGFKSLQEYICSGLENLDGKAVFRSDAWTREAGGGGRTNILKDGNLLEKGGVAFSEVFGEMSPEMKQQLHINGEGQFYATGVSIVLHPENPHVPIIHMNVRYFELDENRYWFGGGIDLTPHYVIPEQAVMFHQRLKAICDPYDSTFYEKFKAQADDYFFLPHRGESRGIGGIFYDHLSESNSTCSKDQLADFAIALGQNFVSIYEEQAALGRNKAYTDREIAWRNLRRGRYVEFNLVHDRGTKFGLHSGGRTESILMSLPPRAEWEYDFQPENASAEEQTLNFLKIKNNWI